MTQPDVHIADGPPGATAIPAPIHGMGGVD